MRLMLVFAGLLCGPGLVSSKNASDTGVLADWSVYAIWHAQYSADSYVNCMNCKRVSRSANLHFIESFSNDIRYVKQSSF